jgi:hypothetical protein
MNMLFTSISMTITFSLYYQEYLYHNKHKIDIRFDIGDKIFLIEIDDDSHFSTSTVNHVRLILMSWKNFSKEMMIISFSSEFQQML